WCETPAAWPPERRGRSRRIPDPDGPWSAYPWPAAPGPARWSGLESAENAFHYAQSWASFPVLSWLREPLEYHYLAGLSPARRRPSMHKKQGSALQSRTLAGKTLPDIQENQVMAATGAEKSQNPAGG